MARFPYRGLCFSGAFAGLILMFLALNMGYRQVAIFFGISAVVQFLVPCLPNLVNRRGSAGSHEDETSG